METVWQFLKIKQFIVSPSKSTPGHIVYLNKLKPYAHHKNLYIDVPSIIILAKKWQQTNCTPTGEWINKMLYLYSGILCSHKKEWSTGTCYNMNELWKHYAKWKKPDTNDHILYNSIYMKCPE